MTKRRWSLNSIVVSAMVSDSRVFAVRKFPDWTRLFWLLWLFVPVLVSTILSTFERLYADWQAGCQVIAALALPLTFAAG